MKINELIKFYRKSLNLTQVQLAEKLKTTHDTISLWELGKSKPDYDAIQKLCILFNINGDEVLDLEDKYLGEQNELIGLTQKQLRVLDSIKNLTDKELIQVLKYVDTIKNDEILRKLINK